MTVPLILVVAMVVLFACGFTLMLDRGLTRILLGFLLVGNGANLMIFLMSGTFGHAPIAGESAPEEMSDPLPQAFILTSIVITFGVSAFLLALIYRSWRLDREEVDVVSDDAHDLELAQTAGLPLEEFTDAELTESSDFDDDGDDSAVAPASRNDPQQDGGRR